VIFAATNTALWYLARAAGTVALIALSLTVLLGIVSWSRVTATGWPRLLTTNVHRNTSMLALVLVAVHIVAVVLDGFVPIAWLDAVIPFRSMYRPTWLGLGAMGFDLMIALAVTGLLRRRIGWKRFRTLHWAAYAAWGLVMVHSIGTGTDPRQSWFKMVVLVVLVAVIGAAAARSLMARSQTRTTHAAAAVGVIVAACVLVVWATHGPLKAGWAARAGTPPAVLAKVRAQAVGVTLVATAKDTTAADRARALRALPSLPFQSPIAGSAQIVNASDGTPWVVIDTQLQSTKARLRLSAPTAGGPVNIVFGPSSDAARFRGVGVVNPDGSVTASIQAGRTAIHINVQLLIDLNAGSATGTISAQS
jgi:methionine sulfoxide reductase heme-binding subunit